MQSPQSSCSYSATKEVTSFYAPSDATTFDLDSPVVAMLSEQTRSIPKTLTSYRILSTPSLVAVAWLLCCGTPDRTEYLVEDSGPFPAFCGILLFTVCYAIPFSFVVAELCTAFPDDGGVAIWVQKAFGPFWGFQTGLWVWLSLICSCATSPNVFSARISDVFGEYPSPMVETIVKMVIAMFMAIPSFFGTRVVGRLSLYLMVVVLVPFVVLSGINLACGRSWGDLFATRRVNETTHDDNTMTFTGPAKVDVVYIFQYVFYLFDGTVMMSVFGGEVANPSSTYRRAIFIKLAFHVATILIPLSSAVVYARPKWYHFGEGTFKQIANSFSPELANLIQVSSDISSLGVFVACMFSQTFLLCGMAKSSMIPRRVARRNARFGTPNLAAFCGVAMAMVSVVVDPDLLGILSSALTSLSQFVMMAAIIRLRLVVPQAFKQTRLPNNIVALCAVMIMPMLVLCYMVYTVFSSGETAFKSLAIFAVGFLLGVGLKWFNKPTASVEEDRDIAHEVQEPMMQM